MTNSSYSAVIIARNEETHIKKTVESLLDQTIRPYRIVVVDDGSTDATPDILREMPVDVKHLPVHDDKHDVYYGTLHDIRNAGLVVVRDDPVDWVYSGDADIILPPKYCETIMNHAEKYGAYIGAGIEKNKYDQLPMDGCRMIKHNWLRSEGMTTKWESIYLCVKALAAGHRTMVRYTDDCVVTSQRPTGTAYAANSQYNQGTLTRKMGAPIPYVCWKAGVLTKSRGIRAGLLFLRGWGSAKIEVPDHMQRSCRQLLNEYLMVRLFGRLGRRQRMFRMYDGSMVCGPGGSN